MKLIAIGYTEMKGVSKKTGNEYHMGKLSVLSNQQDASTENYQKSGYGYQVMEMNVDVKSHHRFDTLSYPCHIDLEVDHHPRGGQVEVIITGFNGQPVPVNLAPVVKAA